MSEEYSRFSVFIFIIIAIVVLGAIIVYALPMLPVGFTPHNQSSVVCNAGQTCSLQNTTDFLKENLTDAQKKMSTDLLQLTGSISLPSGMTRDAFEAQMKQDRQLTWVDEEGAPSTDTKTGLKVVYIYIKTRENTPQNLVYPYVWNISNADPANNIVVAWVEPDNLLKLASLESVQSIWTVMPPVTN